MGYILVFSARPQHGTGPAAVAQHTSATDSSLFLGLSDSDGSGVRVDFGWEGYACGDKRKELSLTGRKTGRVPREASAETA